MCLDNEENGKERMTFCLIGTSKYSDGTNYCYIIFTL